MIADMLLPFVVASSVCGETITDVCSLFKDLPKHDGQIVAVRGKYVSGVILGVDPKCANRFESRSRRWPTAISVAPTGGRRQASLPANFRRDSTAIKGFFRIVNEAQTRPGTQIEATFIGFLEAKKDLHPLIGYGQLNAFAAEITLATVRDWKVIETDADEQRPARQ